MKTNNSKGDILDTCKDKSVQIAIFSVPKLIKKNRLFFYLFQLVFLPAVCLLFSSFHLIEKKSFGITRVVIDAGHGGHDSGCLGKKSKEKDIALNIALKLGQLISDKYPEVKVIYTRKTDEFIELHERATIANNAKADLFICIHCNSACYYDKKKKRETCNEETNGVETWVMGLHKSEAQLEVAKRENEVVLLEKDYTAKYDGFDPNSPEANIIFSLYQNTFLDQSLRLASFVQQEIKTKGRESRGVKQAGFLVLYKTSMPSVLIETGFLSNPDEERYLSSSKGQDESANSIFKAFKSYKSSVETGKMGISENSNDSNDKVKPEKDTQVIDDKPDTPEKVSPSTNQDSKDSKIQWAVQFYTSPKKLAQNSPKLKDFEDIRVEKVGSAYKYTAGLFEKLDEAVNYQSKIRKSGYSDAFVVGYYRDKKVSFSEAVEISKRK